MGMDLGKRMTVILSAKFIAQAQAVGINLTAGTNLTTAIATTMFMVQVGDTKYTMLTRPLDDGAPQFFQGSPFDGRAITLDEARIIFDLHCLIASPHDSRHDAKNMAIIKKMLDNPADYPTAWAPRPDTHGDRTPRSGSTAPSPKLWPWPPAP